MGSYIDSDDLPVTKTSEIHGLWGYCADSNDLPASEKRMMLTLLKCLNVYVLSESRICIRKFSDDIFYVF